MAYLSVCECSQSGVNAGKEGLKVYFSVPTPKPLEGHYTHTEEGEGGLSHL